MQLPEMTPMSVVDIQKPRWKQRVVGIASFRVGQHNKVRILATGKDGERYYPDDMYISGEDVKKHPVQLLPSGVKLYLVPISDLERLELV